MTHKVSHKAPSAPGAENPAWDITRDDVFLFNEGTHYRLYEKLGAHALGKGKGVAFAVWAPNARLVSVVKGIRGATIPGASAFVSTGVWKTAVSRGNPYRLSPLNTTHLVPIDFTARRSRFVVLVQWAMPGPYATGDERQSW